MLHCVEQFARCELLRRKMNMDDSKPKSPLDLPTTKGHLPKKRDRVAEGRYAIHADELRSHQANRRELARRLRETGASWSEIGAILGVTAAAARMLASRA